MAIGDRLRKGGAGIFSYFARHPTAANLLMVIMLLFGLVSATQIRTQFFPDIVTNSIYVTMRWDGAGPQDVDAGIVAFMEPALRVVDGVESSEARSSEGRASVDLDFEPGWDMTRAMSDVETAIASLTTLPEGAEDAQIRRSRWSDRVTDVIISGPIDVTQLGQIADDFVTRLYARGITQTSISGIADPLIRVSIPADRLVEHGINLSDAVEKVSELTTGGPAGEIADTATRLRAGEDVRDLDAIGGIVLQDDPSGARLYLRDVADISLDPAAANKAYYSYGVPAVAVRVSRSARGDAIGVQEQVAQVAAEMNASLPQGSEIKLVRTRAEYISNRLDLLLRNGIMGLVLVLALLFLFLSARTAIWVAAGIPVAMAAAIAAMYAAGLTLNLISLFGLILCLGLVVDDAIVVGEHADWRRRRGDGPAQAAEQAALRMASPVFSAMITTVLAFVGLTFIGGRFGSMIADIPMTVIVVLLASFAECFLILPHHMSQALAAERKKTWIDAPSRMVNRGLDTFRRRVFVPLMAGIIRLRYPVIAAIILLLAQSGAMFLRGDVTWRFFAPPERGSLTGNIAMLPGAKRDDTMAMVRELERAFGAVAQRYAAEHGTNPVTSVVSQIGGNSGRGLSGADTKDPDQLGAVDVELIDPDFRPYSSQVFLNDVQDEVVRHAKLETLSFRSWGSGPGGDAIDIKIEGDDPRLLKRAATALKVDLATEPLVSGLEDSLSYDKVEYLMTLTDLGSRLGFSVDRIGAELKARLSGVDAAEFAAGTRTATIRVGLPEDELTADILERTFLPAPSGAQMPLRDIVSLQTRLGFSSLARENGKLIVRVTGVIAEEDAAAAADLMRRIEDRILPEIEARFGVGTTLAGQAEQERNFLGDALYGFLLCLLGIYLTLAWVFESWIRPIVVIAIIPLGLIGTIWGHLHWDIALSIFTIVGLIGMTGIIINNAIVLIATMDGYRVRHALKPAMLAACGDRLRPILITTLTTILGLTPLLFERSQQALFLKPTVVTLVYGLGVGAVLTLIAIPALVFVQQDITMAVRAWRRAMRTRPGIGPDMRLASMIVLLWCVATFAPSVEAIALPDALSPWQDLVPTPRDALVVFVTGLPVIGLFAAIRIARRRQPGRTA